MTIPMRVFPCRILFLIQAIWISCSNPVRAGQQRSPARLFTANQTACKWLEFQAAGFAHPVCGVIYHPEQPPCCGVPLGGVATGCIDVDARGAFGFNALFNLTYREKAFSGKKGNVFVTELTRKLPDYPPFLGLSVGQTTWVLADASILAGGRMETCVDPVFIDRKESIDLAPVRGVRGATRIDYWGHYPVVDMEYVLEAPASTAQGKTRPSPISAGLRAWAPFIPGDMMASSSPCAFFEVHLRNQAREPQRGTLAFSFPGPAPTDNSKAPDFTRSSPAIDHCKSVEASDGQHGFLLGVLDEEHVRLGGSLGRNGAAWLNISSQLPEANPKDPGASIAVNFSLAPREHRKIVFVLSWFAPLWHGGDERYYTEMYGTRFSNPTEVARSLVPQREPLLRRILNWQQVVYSEKQLPVWLRETLVNNLCLIPETSYWAAAKPPLGNWCYQGGFFGMYESPRGSPQIECNPCTWYGNLPIVYFFPELARSTLTAHRHYMREDGSVPFVIGGWGRPDMNSPSHDWQISLNGPAYIMMIDRLWRRTGDPDLVKDFYPSIKKTLTMTMNLRPTPEGAISMPSDNRGMEWFEWGEWRGMCAHIGGLRLATLRIVERMAEAMEDQPFAEQCRKWFANGSNAMETKLWAGSYYLNFFEEESAKKSTAVMAYQLDGQWAARFHGFDGVQRPERVPVVLDTIRRCNMPSNGFGAINFATRDGRPLSPDEKVAEYGSYSMFLPEVMILGMTYIYSGQRDFGNELIRRAMEQMVLVHRHPWDLPNAMHGDNGERQFGTDYYQNMMLWAAPAAYEKTDIAGLSQKNGFVERILRAAREN